ncbi:putative helicase MOV-10 isoform X2 [Phlebotomus argentipes]|uniref:putative helicase MOV-10 isoform X2 n=1 Tax=Phlebotomus argentipes TaxID=94469 RepID=UPI002892D3BE|nr:putative helicase MOV-10 isoform X2 [Phlebotomus argentipes]
MAQKSASRANGVDGGDAMRENVEKLLAKLCIDGEIENNRLTKKTLRKAVEEFAVLNDIENFEFKDVQKTMLKHKICATKKTNPFKSPFFKVFAWKIQKFVMKYGQEEDFFYSYDLVYISTIKKDRNAVLAYEIKKCCECKKTYKSLTTFLEHMKTHDKDLADEGSQSNKQLVELVMECQEKDEKLIFNVLPNNSEMKIAIEGVLFEIPHLQIFFDVATYDEGCIKFAINRSILAVDNQPYSVILSGTTDCEMTIWTQYHFTLGKYNYALKEEPIKSYHNTTTVLPEEFPKTILGQLPGHYPSQEMKSLTKKMFKNTDLTDEEAALLKRINAFLKSKLTVANYTQLWKIFVEMEDCEEQERIAKLNQYDVKLDAKRTDGGIFYFLENAHNADSWQIPEGSDVRIWPSRESKCVAEAMFGYVYQMRKKDILLDIKNPEHFDKNLLYDVCFSPNRVTIQMQKEALEYVDKHMIEKFFFPDAIPTHSIDSSGFEWINDSVKENPEQQSAIIHMVEKSSFPAPYILMGPPGTGKTTTIVETICQIIRRKPEAKILISTTSNNTTNVITLRLLKYFKENEILRLFSKSHTEEIESIDPRVMKASNLKYNAHYYPTLDELYKYRVVLTTLVTAGRLTQMKIDPRHFSYVFIDECGSGTEPSTLIPIAGVVSSLGEIHAQVILAGDPKQLGPVVMVLKAQPRLGISLLDRLVDSGIYAKDPETGKYNPRVMTKLLRNYRSHPKILEFPSDAFYDGDLIAEADKEIAFWACDWQLLPNPKIPIIFENVEGEARSSVNFPSLFNWKEVSRVLFYINKILKAKSVFGKAITQKSIGVISPYKAQCQKIAKACARMKLDDIEIGSVEKFQGNEKPIIILSTARSKMNSVGFVGNPKRLNVAVTRAQALLIIVGNVETLEKSVTWSKFISFCRDNNVMIN